MPAAFNNLVGLKPTKGLFSTAGVVPACRSLDCVSVLATTVADAWLVATVAAGFDAGDPFSRAAPAPLRARPVQPGFRFGVPGPDALAACPAEALVLFEAAAERLERLGGRRVGFDDAPFREAAALLYAGPWLAERLHATRDLLAADPGSLHPAVRDVIAPALGFTALEAFAGQYRLAALRRAADAEWAGMDIMLLPTAPVFPTIAAMLADPVGLNARLGTYTNFVNLLDLSALAVPAGFTPDGMPFGVTLIGPAFADGVLAGLGDALHRADARATLGGSARALAETPALACEADPDTVEVAVVGAHLSGQPLNAQLTSRGARLVRTARTAPGYSLYALPGTVPPKPALVRDGGAGGIELEVWRIAATRYGALVAEIPAPLGIGRVSLADGTVVQGFLVEAHATQGAEDITALGGWRGYLAR